MSDGMMAVRLTGGDVVRREISYWDEIIDECGSVVARVPVPVVRYGELLVRVFGDEFPLIVRADDS